MDFLNVKDRIRGRLLSLYGPKKAGVVLDSIEKLCNKYAGKAPAGRPGWSEGDALLITYGDTLLGSAGSAPLSALGRFLDAHVGDNISFLHILPFFPYTSDDGFSVTDYRAVNPELGGWEHVKALGGRYRLMFDAVINHVSPSSHYMIGQCDAIPVTATFCSQPTPQPIFARW
jgi:sucrose phosphorylase